VIIWTIKEGGRGMMALPKSELTVRVEKIKLYPIKKGGKDLKKGGFDGRT
jgi:hypothetical protein